LTYAKLEATEMAETPESKALAELDVPQSASHDHGDMRRELPSGTVTFLFTDVEGSTKLLHELGAEAYAETLAEHRTIVRKACFAHRGIEVDTQGDAFFLAFRTAPEALEAAHAITAELAPGPISLRIGLHTGTPLRTDEGYVGDDVHLAARVAASAHGGQVVLSQATRALIDERHSFLELGEHRLKDIPGPIPIFQLGDSQFPPLKTISNTNLPRPASSFVGRERELEEVLGRIEGGARLVTLTGPGGSGKTRLALEAATSLVPDYKAGVFWVGLASLSEPKLVTETIAQTLGAKNGLDEDIGEREMLLLLDNLEQVIDAAPELSALMAPCPNLTLLVTSRELLHVQGEVEYAVPPLAEGEAISLFCERAQTAPNEEIGQLCRRLDSLPLAVELAAARAKALSPRQILERLSQRLDLLRGGRDADPRQQTLRATIAWSYDLLSEAEQRVFCSLSVFAGGCTLEAAEEVANAGLDSLQSLVEKSLLRVSDERFWMLETIRAYGLEQFASDAACDEVRDRHATQFLELAEHVDLALRYSDDAGSYDDLDLELANLREAITWTRACGRSEVLLRFAAALWRFWSARGYVSEGRAVMEEAGQDKDEVPPQVLLGRCTLRLLAGAGADEVMADANAALEVCEQSGDDFSRAQAWNLMARLRASLLAQIGPAEQASEQALFYALRGNHKSEKAESIWVLTLAALAGPLPVPAAIARADELLAVAAGEPESRAFCLSARGALVAMTGDFELGRAQLAQGTAAFEQLGLSVWAANNAQLAFIVETLAGRPAKAAQALRTSYELLAEMGERGFLSTIAGYLAHVLFDLGDYEEADRFSRVAENAAAPDDLISQILWRGAQAKVLSHRSDFAGAQTLARESVDLAETTDLLTAQGDSFLVLAHVLSSAGRSTEAMKYIEQGMKRFAAKGNSAALERASAAAAALAAAAD